jgi:SRSO17 transposase
MSKKRIIRLLKERYRTERAYQELKTELGLDHFEGRSFRGWHHHASVVLCCYAFVAIERLQHFPPSEVHALEPSDAPLRLAS